MVPPDAGSFLSARSGNDSAGREHAFDPGGREHAFDPAEREQAYGPIRFRRYAKGDGRALILYTQGELVGGGSAHGGDGSSSAHDGHERA